MISSSQLNNNLCFIRSKIQNAAQQSGRNADEITLVAVTKAFPPEFWNLALENNLSIIGESRIQEIENKIKQTHNRQQIELHLIGHLQSNKVRKAINNVDIIQTVDSIKLLERINQISNEENKQQRIFLQINSGSNQNKVGFTEEDVFSAARRTTKLQDVSLKGIMTIPPPNLQQKELCRIYEKTRKIRNKIQQTIQKNCSCLSMGMSNDFEIAINEGATHIRIGTSLFGKRPK